MGDLGSVTNEHQQEKKILPFSLSPHSELDGFEFSSSGSTLDHLCAFQTTEGDVSLEWLSAYVEECLSNKGNCLPAPAPTPTPTQLSQPQKPLHHFAVPAKARSKRKRTTSKTNIDPFLGRWLHQLNSQHNHSLQLTTSADPLLLHQTYWLADSELIIPQKEKNTIDKAGDEKHRGKEEDKVENVDHKKAMRGLEMQQPAMGKKCSHCLAQRTPQWRAGPLGPKTLCNACGVRYKSGRLLPEYRPAKSPTFVSYLHSNSHKRVMEMRLNASPIFPSSP